MGPVNSEYKIEPYSPEYLSQVVHVMEFLWGKDFEKNLAYFQWKHINNPYSEQPLGMVSLFRGRVVGFRAYFPLKYQTGSSGKTFILLVPGDTCVHPDHRRKGLSVAMGGKAIQEYQLKYKVFLNTSSSFDSLPGYIKLGFHPLAPKFSVPLIKKGKSLKDFLPAKAKKFIARSKPFRKLHPVSGKHKKQPTEIRKINLGEFGNIMVSDRPKPEEMSSVISGKKRKDQKIRLCQDETFFRWRFLNNKNKYIFYFLRDNKSITGYVVLGVSADNTQGQILDYAECGSKALGHILRFILDSRQFDMLSVLSFGVNQQLLHTLEDMGLSPRGFAEKRSRYKEGELALLIRPVKKERTEEDWFLDGFDIRKFSHWEIKPVTCDGE
jgi:GNAT superfamily N-acetyltransferase